MLDLTVPIQLVSESNARCHWAVKAKRVKTQRAAVAMLLGRKPRPPFPVVVTLTRIGPRKLDTDNLAGSAKAVRDAVAAWLGVDDGPDSPVTWRYEQRTPAKGESRYAVRICITGAADTRDDC